MTDEEILERRIELKEQVIVLYEMEKTKAIHSVNDYCKRLDDDIGRTRKEIAGLKEELDAVRRRQAA